MKKKKVICIGEALIDRIRNKSNQGFTDFLGGAPANVACALRKLKIDSIFIGRLGSDDYGKKFITKFNELGVNLDFLQIDSDSSTRVVNVDRDQFGDRFFSGVDSFDKDQEISQFFHFQISDLFKDTMIMLLIKL